MDRTRFSINWDLCVLCQLDNTTEKLVSPVYDKRKDRGSGYKSLAENLPKFKEAGEWPIQVPLSLLDDGGGIEENLRINKASWHKTCFNKCSSAKLTRAQKRKHAEASKESDEETSRNNQVRSKLDVQPLAMGKHPSLRQKMAQSDVSFVMNWVRST